MGRGGGVAVYQPALTGQVRGRLPTMTMRNPKSYESNKMQIIIYNIG